MGELRDKGLVLIWEPKIWNLGSWKYIIYYLNFPNWVHIFKVHFYQIYMSWAILIPIWILGCSSSGVVASTYPICFHRRSLVLLFSCNILWNNSNPASERLCTHSVTETHSIIFNATLGTSTHAIAWPVQSLQMHGNLRKIIRIPLVARYFYTMKWNKIVSEGAFQFLSFHENTDMYMKCNVYLMHYISNIQYQLRNIVDVAR